jgi:hypothetical protein
MFTVDVESRAVNDPNDRYSAHLIFGGAGGPPGQKDNPGQKDDIVAFWADSFGGAYTALGRGDSRSDGFDVSYQYPSSAFLNRWTLSGDKLKWLIVEKEDQKLEKPFAVYALRRAPCGPAPG